MDGIGIEGLACTALLAENPWPTLDKAAEQPVDISLRIQGDLSAAGEKDSLADSVDYSSLAKHIRTVAQAESSTAYALARSLLEHASALVSPSSHLDLDLTFPKAVLRASSASLHATHPPSSPSFRINDLSLHTIIGINPHERIHKQPVVISLTCTYSPSDPRPLQHNFKFPFPQLETHIAQFIETSSYQTIEALAYRTLEQSFIALASESSITPNTNPINPDEWTIAIELAKPAAIRLARAPVVSLQRRAADFPRLGALLMGEEKQMVEERKTESPTVNPNLPPAVSTKDRERKPVLAALALGSNLGDRFQNVERALRLLEHDKHQEKEQEQEQGGLRVIATSFLYETAPMYVTAQPAFVNCAALVETTLSPTALLRLCKSIEHVVGRVPSIRFGPRAIDLDVITYGSHLIDTRAEGKRGGLELSDLEGELVVPHPRMQEREFVLRPLADIIPEWVHPALGKTVRALLAQVESQKPPQDPPMQKVISFPVSPTLPSLVSGIKTSEDDNRDGVLNPDEAPATQAYWTFETSSNSNPASPPLSSPYPPPAPRIQETGVGSGRSNRRTFVMATLNATPDSFSDGALHASPTTALQYARAAVRAGADIIDIGGYSTRPGAKFVSPEEEIQRVVPIILAIRAYHFDASANNNKADPDETKEEEEAVRKVLISVDTFRPEVAAAAIEAGANCINDVYAFTGPSYPPLEEEVRKVRADMIALARRTGVPVIMMHSRGEAGKNKDYSALELSTQTPTNEAEAELGRDLTLNPVLRAVQLELGAKVSAVLGSGELRRWQVIVDPGIGFSKSVEGNLELLRGTARLTAYETSTSFNGGDGDGDGNRDPVCATPGLNPLAGFPILIGTSRKSFLGSILAAESFALQPLPEDSSQTPAPAPSQAQGQGSSESTKTRPAKERDFATAAAIACAVQQGATVVRVHAVQEMVDVVKVAEALWS